MLPVVSFSLKGVAMVKLVFSDSSTGSVTEAVSSSAEGAFCSLVDLLSIRDEDDEAHLRGLFVRVRTVLNNCKPFCVEASIVDADMGEDPVELSICEV